jgi:hypothetical protein
VETKTSGDSDFLWGQWSGQKETPQGKERGSAFQFMQIPWQRISIAAGATQPLLGASRSFKIE